MSQCDQCGAELVEDSCARCPPEANAPVDEATYLESLGVDLQCDIDDALREGYHVTGLRPYRVWLVWRKRGRDYRWDVVREIELMPVKVEALDATDLELLSMGLSPEGPLTLTQISPRQVSELDLRGKWNGSDLPENYEFFYRIVKRPFPGQPTHPPRRYILVTEPHHDGEQFQYVVNLRAQKVPDDLDGEDQQFGTPKVRRIKANL